MPRLIDADALKKKAAMHGHAVRPLVTAYHMCVSVHDIDDAPTIDPTPKWIPVTERLLDLIPCNAGTAYSEAVIVWTDGKKAMVAVWDGTDFLCAADYWEAWDENITHWIPLPKPPEMIGGAECEKNR